jgi:three-Cys-motif partner protein
MKDDQAKKNLLPHSEAKVQLYGYYLGIYLNVLARAGFSIYIFDFLCGEGKYENDGEGSPLVALNVIKRHYFANNETCPSMEVWFNDNGESLIEPGISKIERVKRLSETVFRPENVKIKFYALDYRELLNQALATFNRSTYSKGLFFIDPYGYKEIKPYDIKQILANGHAEVLLFLDIADMYRFWNTAVSKSFAGSEPLEAFMKELYDGEEIPLFFSPDELIIGLKARFKEYLFSNEVYVANFRIERDASRIYALFFFTCSLTGLHKMLDAIWKMDFSRGQGYSANQQPMLLTEAELRGYPAKLRNFLISELSRTNSEIYKFGLEQGFLPKHTAEYLRQWQKEEKLNVIAQDGQTVPKNAFYLSAKPKRFVSFQAVNL